MTRTETTWRVAYGSWWAADVDTGGLTWQAARDILRSELALVLEENTGIYADCAQEAQKVLAALDAAGDDGTEIDAEVEGQPYRITREAS